VFIPSWLHFTQSFLFWNVSQLHQTKLAGRDGGLRLRKPTSFDGYKPDSHRSLSNDVIVAKIEKIEIRALLGRKVLTASTQQM
jgi:hypothetical protein